MGNLTNKLLINTIIPRFNYKNKNGDIVKPKITVAL